MEWYIKAFKNFANFEGRARRKEYWMFILINMIISFSIGFVEGLFGGSGTLGLLYSLVVIIPGIAVGARRLHDMGRTGWWLLIGLLPVIGFIVLIFFLVQDSEQDNRWGPNPKLAG